MNESVQMSLESWLNEVYSMARPECPPRELLHRLAIRDLSAVQRERLEEHLSGCRECAAEHDMAVLYERDAVDHLDAGKIAEIVAGLEAESPVRTGASPHRNGSQEGTRHPVPGWAAWPHELPTWQVAAAAALLIGLTVATWPRPPALPAAHETTLRGTTVQAISPQDDVVVSPSSFVWHPYPNATTYRVRLLRVDDTVLWEGIASGSRIDLPTAVTESLQALVRYDWTIEALNETGALVATSGLQHFRILPADARLPQLEPNDHDE